MSPELPINKKMFKEKVLARGNPSRGLDSAGVTSHKQMILCCLEVVFFGVFDFFLIFVAWHKKVEKKYAHDESLREQAEAE